MSSVVQQSESLQAVIGTRDGEYISGVTEAFHPDRFCRVREDQEWVIPPDKLSFVAFPEQTLSAEGAVRLVRVHLQGGWQLELELLYQDDSKLGYYGRATSSAGSLFFYLDAVIELIDMRMPPVREALTVVEDGEPEEMSISAMMMEIISDEGEPLGAESTEERPIPEAKSRPRLRLGELLVQERLISSEELEVALDAQKTSDGKRLGQILLETGKVSEQALFLTLARAFRLELVDLDDVTLDMEVVEWVGMGFIEEHAALPLARTATTLTLAICDPLNPGPADFVRFNKRIQVEEVLITPSEMERQRRRLLSRDGSLNDIDRLIQTIKAPRGGTSGDAIIKLADQVLKDAIELGTSDIHIEPNGPEQSTLIRLRVDGECQVYKRLPPAVRQPLVTRMKILAELDIAERRKPQDGKIKFRMPDGSEVELRVSTMPTVNGNEDMVLRVLASSKPLPLEDMGFNPRNLKEFQQIMRQPYGMVLCVGPTGSGKTTTLHSALSSINSVGRQIWTAEDPVEITQPGLRQVQVKPRIGFDFAAAMRGFLRLDPDVIMIGEMRDLETSNIAIEAALTGHLVLSTLHTNSAPETVTRLMDQGINPFSLADAFLGVLAQRLLRRLCKSCKAPRPATPSELETVRRTFGEEGLLRRLGLKEHSELQFWEAPGCPSCRGTGYKGRLAVHELLIVNEELAHAIQTHKPAAKIRELGIKNGMTTLRMDGIEKAVRGLTDLRQVIAVCGD